MPSKTLFRAGIAAVLVGIYLFWSIPVWLRFFEIYPWNYQVLAPVLLWFCVSLAGAGGLLLWRAAFRSLPLRWESDRCLRMCPSMMLRNVLPRHGHRPTPLITQLPNFGLICGALLWILIFAFIIFAEPRHYYGLLLEFTTRDFVIWEKSPWKEALSVYLGAGEKYYVNGQQVPREALRERLQQELNGRIAWTVYFEADYDTLNMDAIYAMDTIQGVGAKLIWITPQVREELQQKGQPARQRLDR